MVGIEHMSPVVVCFRNNINPSEYPVVMRLEHKGPCMVIMEPVIMVPVKQDRSFIFVFVRTMMVSLVENPVRHMPVMSGSVSHGPHVAPFRWCPVSNTARWNRTHMTGMAWRTGYLGRRYRGRSYFAGRT
jgi:hypothetical protein